MTDKLEPCPLCRSTNIIGGEHDGDPVYCRSCWLRAPNKEVWNTRAPQPTGEVSEADREAATWLRECSDWMLANDLDMTCPMQTDPLDLAEALDAARAHRLASTAQAQAEIARLKARVEELEGHIRCLLDDSHSYESEGYARDAARAALKGTGQ